MDDIFSHSMNSYFLVLTMFLVKRFEGVFVIIIYYERQ